jgi:GAF domain-containing protein
MTALSEPPSCQSSNLVQPIIRRGARPGFDISRAEKVERLLAVRRAARAMADSAAAWWKELIDASDAVVTAEALDRFYAQALRAMQSTLGADEVSILLADHDGQALTSRASIGLGESNTVSLRIPAGQGMAGLVLASCEPLIIDDLADIDLVSPVLKERGLRSVVAVPIQADTRVLGVLHAGSKYTGQFTTSDAELLELLAGQLSLTIQRVQLFEQQRYLAKLAVFLADTARIMAGASDLQAALEALAAAALPALGDLCLIDMVDDGGEIRRRVARHVDVNRQPLADRLRDKFPPMFNSKHPAAQILRMGGSKWSASMPDDFLRATTRNDDHYRLTKELGFRSYVAVPIETNDTALGVLTIVSCSRALTASDVAFAESLAFQVGSVVSNAWRLDVVSDTSNALQEALLPSGLPEIPGLRVHASYAASSKAMDVGGDFYDVMWLPDGNAWFIIGDVVGHDRQAASAMGQLRSAARVLALQGKDPPSALAEIRSLWPGLGLTRMATLLIGQVDPTTGRTALSSAGHPPPLLVTDVDAAFVALRPAPLLGVDGNERLSELTIEPGQTLLLYTDGMLNERVVGIDTGMSILRDRVAQCGRDPKILCGQLIKMVSKREDDIALLAVQRL